MNEDNRQNGIHKATASTEDSGEYVLNQDDSELERY